MKKIFNRVLLALLLGGAAVAAQNTPLAPAHKTAASAVSPAPPAAALVARVNGAGLTQRDLQREMKKLFPFARVHGGRVPGPFQAEIRQNALDQIIVDELLHQEARRRGMTAPVAMFNDVLRQAKGRFPTKANYEAYAKAEYGSVVAFENQLRRGLLIALLLDQEVAQKARVSDAQIRQFYNANQKRFLKPESAWVQSISLQFPANATPAQRAQARRRAEEVLPQARAARSYEAFGKLAEKYSEDDWRVMMGDHRWIHRGRMPAAVENVAFRLKEGEVSGIIETVEAFVIVRVNASLPQTQIPFAQVSQALREDLEKATQADLRKKFEQRLRQTFKIEVL